MAELIEYILKRVIFFFFFVTWGILPAQIVKVSQKNPHLLKQEDGTPFFYLGDTAWELFHCLNRAEADQYLQDRVSKGFNVIQAVALAELDGLDQPNAYGQVPLLEKNIHRHNDRYFEHVDYTIDKASALGMYIGLLPSWGEYVTPRFTEQFFKSTEEGYGYGWYLGNRYTDRKNIIWILGGDRLPDEAPNGISIWRAMDEGIADGIKGVKALDGEADFSSTTLSYHSFPSSSQWFHQEPWMELMNPMVPLKTREVKNSGFQKEKARIGYWYWMMKQPALMFLERLCKNNFLLI